MAPSMGPIMLLARVCLFVTVFFAHWDPKKGLLSYANGGHNPPLLLKANGEHNWLQAPGIALGILPEIDIPRNTIQLLPGDTLILYTDGVTEAQNPEGDFFTAERLKDLLKENCTSASEKVNQIKKAINDHNREAAPFDDITMLAVKKQ